MMLVPIATALLCACVSAVTSFGLLGAGLPVGIGQFGHKLGRGGYRGFGDMEEDQVLTCANTELGDDESVLFSVAVTIRQDSSSRSGWGVGGLPGWYGMGRDPYSMDRDKGGLSAQIEIINNVRSGQGLVAFTVRAQPENLCALDGTGDFGPILMADDDYYDYDNGYGGYGAYGGYGGYSYGIGHPLMGYGLGFGFGDGMGYLGLGMGDFDDFSTSDDGVIGEIPITQGVISTLTVDGLPFDDLAELAGRGLLICSSVTTTTDSNYVCEKPFFACCQLRYDQRDSSLLS